MLIEEEENKNALGFIKKLNQTLTKEEQNFLSAIYRVCERSDVKLIAEASSNLGISNAKGWDIFRRIQRKSKNLIHRSTDRNVDYSSICHIESRPKIEDFIFNDFKSEEIIAEHVSEYNENLDYGNKKSAESEAHDKLLSKASDDQLKKLSDLYSGNEYLSVDNRKEISSMKKLLNYLKKMISG